jgi:hypothetical protein
MNALVGRAIDEYHDLVRDEKALVEEYADAFFKRMRDEKLTFGGRILCPFVRPNFVSGDQYTQIQSVCRAIFAAIEKVEDRLGEKLWDMVDLTEEERDLARIDPGYRRSSPTARIDSFLTPSSYQFVELNAESPAGIAYSECLGEVFLGLPIMKKFQERYSLKPFHGREKMLETLLSCYREAGGTKANPTIAIVDYEDVPTRNEHHLFAEFFEARGYPSLVCDPLDLTFEGGALRFEGRPIDIVYKRLLVNEFLEKKDQLKALLDAARSRAAVFLNPFRCKAIHKKAIFAVITDDDVSQLFTNAERDAIAAHIPWTRRVVEGKTTHKGQQVDLITFVRENRERLVMKPNDEYGGKGVFIGWETSAADWDAALATALAQSFVVQEKVELGKQPFPELINGELIFRDFILDVDPCVFNGEVEGFLTRLSSTSLANVTSGGGQVPVFQIAPV